MLGNIIELIKKGTSAFSTYHVGLIQARGYRALKQHMTAGLKEFDIAPIEWGLLGVLYEHKNEEGVRMMDLAEMLGITAPFVTMMVDRLEEKKIIFRDNATDDRRVKYVALTKEGIVFVKKVEPILRDHMGILIAGAKPTDLLAYVRVLDRIIKQSPHGADASTGIEAYLP